MSIRGYFAPKEVPSKPQQNNYYQRKMDEVTYSRTIFTKFTPEQLEEGEPEYKFPVLATKKHK